MKITILKAQPVKQDTCDYCVGLGNPQPSQDNRFCYLPGHGKFTLCPSHLKYLQDWK